MLGAAGAPLPTACMLLGRQVPGLGGVQGVPWRGLSLLSLNRLPLTRPITANFPKEASELEQEGGGAEEGTPGPSTAHCWALGPTGSASPEG